jgi:ribosomal protein S18 acetylase RimI-like enzyme
MGIAWVRLFVYAGRWSAENAWNMLWDTAKNEIARAGGAKVAVIAMQNWFPAILTASGFENRQNIVMLEWQYQPWASREAEGIRIRKMEEADLREVEIVDAASFPPLWQNPLETLRRAYAQSLIATVAENEHGIIGYQLSTGGRVRAHLARLAVHPSMQGRGISRALVGDLFARLNQFGIPSLSVNTQSDNAVSLSLYKKMGFLRTGEQYPVYTFDVPAYP